MEKPLLYPCCGRYYCTCPEIEDPDAFALDLPPGTLETPEAQDWTPVPDWLEEEE